MNETIDAAVVGGGLSGLAAAALLARRGLRVTVFEGSNRLGGRGQSPLLHGLPVNLGPHALYLGGAGRQVLDELGVRYEGHPPATRGGKVWIDGSLAPLPTGMWGLLTSPLLDWAGRVALGKALMPLLRSPKTDARADESLATWLDRTCPHPRARAVLEMLFRVTTYADAPTASSATKACQQLHRGLAKNVSYLDGGFGGLVEGLRQASGVTRALSSPVRKVLPGGRLILDGGEVTAKTVVIALPLEAAVKVTDDARLKAFASRAVPSFAACLDLVLSSLPRPDQCLAFGVGIPLYVSVHSQTEGAVVLHAARYLSPADDAASVRPSIEALLDALQPGWRDRVLAERYLPRMEVTSCLPLASERGAGFGIQLDANTFLAADWAVGGFLMDGGLEAAREVAALASSSVRLSA